MPTSFRLGLALILISRALVAYGQVEPKLLRFDLTPLVGYRTRMTFTGTPGVEGVKPRVALDASPTYGVAFGARINEEDLIEFRWARQNTHMRVEDADVTPSRQNITVNQFHGDFTHEYILDDWPASVRPFIMGSVGATHVSSSMNSGFTRFSFGLGGGIKVFVNRHLGFRGQGEWLPIVVDPEVAFFCGGGCLIHLRSKLSSQGEFTAGPLLRF